MFKSVVTAFNNFAADNGLYLYLLVFLSGLILFFSVIPPAKGGLNTGLNAHVCGYAVLSFAALLLFRSKKTNSIFLKAVLFAGGYGALIEVIQFPIPFRLFELSDIITNFLASAAGIVPGYFLIKHKWI